MPELDHYKISLAVNDVLNDVCRFFSGGENQILSFEEAVCGIEGNSCLGPIDRTSSMGYPWS